VQASRTDAFLVDVQIVGGEVIAVRRDQTPDRAQRCEMVEQTPQRTVCSRHGSYRDAREAPAQWRWRNGLVTA